MDKLGIFNLLNGLVSFYQQQKNNFGTNGQDVDAPKNQPQTTSQQSKNPQPKVESEVQKPLQAGMLSIMKGHDDIVKRVMAKNKIKN